MNVEVDETSSLVTQRYVRSTSMLMLGMGLAAVFVRRLHLVQAEKRKK